jgi:hypothetical protein
VSHMTRWPGCGPPDGAWKTLMRTLLRKKRRQLLILIEYDGLQYSYRLHDARCHRARFDRRRIAAAACGSGSTRARCAFFNVSLTRVRLVCTDRCVAQSATAKPLVLVG